MREKARVRRGKKNSKKKERAALYRGGGMFYLRTAAGTSTIKI